VQLTTANSAYEQLSFDHGCAVYDLNYPAPPLDPPGYTAASCAAVCDESIVNNGVPCNGFEFSGAPENTCTLKDKVVFDPAATASSSSCYTAHPYVVGPEWQQLTFGQACAIDNGATNSATVLDAAACASLCDAAGASTCVGFNFRLNAEFPGTPLADVNCVYDVESPRTAPIPAFGYAGAIDSDPTFVSICYARGYLSISSEGEPSLRYLSPPPPPLPPAAPAQADGWATTCGLRTAHYLGGGATFVDTGVAPTLWTATAPAALPYVRACSARACAAATFDERCAAGIGCWSLIGLRAAPVNGS
jgi:hypothetical protein